MRDYILRKYDFTMDAQLWIIVSHVKVLWFCRFAHHSSSYGRGHILSEKLETDHMHIATVVRRYIPVSKVEPASFVYSSHYTARLQVSVNTAPWVGVVSVDPECHLTSSSGRRVVETRFQRRVAGSLSVVFKILSDNLYAQRASLVPMISAQ